MSSLLDHLKCPICFEIPEDKVYQCKNGHTFCSECSSRLKACPQCRVVLGLERIRNRTLEQILDATKFGCPNQHLGCARILGRGDISSHLLYCKFEPFYFCKLIGFQNCQYDAVKSLHGHSHDLIAHLKQAHPDIQQSVVETSSSSPAADSSVYLNYANFLSRANKLDKGAVAIWTPHLVKVKQKVNHTTEENQTDLEKDKDDEQNERETLLLVLCQISELTRNAAWICLCMTTDTNRGNGQQLIDVNNSSSVTNNCSKMSTSVIQYQIKGQRGGCEMKNIDQKCENELLTPKMTWKAPVLMFKDIDKELENYALRIPICVLNSFNNVRGDLEISVKVGNNGGEKVQDASQRRISRGGPFTHITELTSFITRPTRRLSKPQCPSFGDDQRVADDADEENENNEVIFVDVFCNGCGQRPLVNVRYKCLQCIDYDLCKECMERGDTHMHHVFARIHSLQQTQLFHWKHRLRMFKGRSSFI